MAAPAPHIIAWVAMVIMAEPITMPASQEAPGREGGCVPVFLRRSIPITLLIWRHRSPATAFDATAAHGHTGRQG